MAFSPVSGIKDKKKPLKIVSAVFFMGFCFTMQTSFK